MLIFILLSGIDSLLEVCKTKCPCWKQRKGPDESPRFVSHAPPTFFKICRTLVAAVLYQKGRNWMQYIGQLYCQVFPSKYKLRFQSIASSYGVTTRKPHPPDFSLDLEKSNLFFLFLHCYHQRKIRWLERDLNSYVHRRSTHWAIESTGIGGKSYPT